MDSRRVCNVCGSDSVRKDAWATWNEVSQAWELDEFFDENDYCIDCDDIVTIVKGEDNG